MGFRPIIPGSFTQSPQQGNGTLDLLGNTPQVDVPSPLFQDKNQILALATLLAFRPQLGSQLLGQQQQRQAQIGQAQATNVGLQQQANIAQASQQQQIEGLNLRREELAAQKERFAMTSAANLRTEERLNRLADARIKSIEAQIEGLGNQFTNAQIGASKRELPSVLNRLNTLTGAISSPSGRASTSELHNEMFAAWQAAGGGEDGLEAAFAKFDEGALLAESEVANSGLLPSDAGFVVEKAANNLKAQINKFNKLITNASEAESRKEAQRIKEQRKQQRIQQRRVKGLPVLINR